MKKKKRKFITDRGRIDVVWFDGVWLGGGSKEGLFKRSVYGPGDVVDQGRRFYRA